MKTALLAVLLAAAACSAPVPEAERPGSEVCFMDSCFAVETATTLPEQAYGLMYRDSLPAGRGMLFVFEDEDVHKFWMKNTYIELDIIWMDRSGRVIHVEHEAKPCNETCPSLGPDSSSRYVLEVPGGTARNLGIGTGDYARISLRT